MTMLFYPSKANDKLNRKWFHPEAVNGRVMLNPNYPIRKLLPGTLAMCDSGAFQDIDSGIRLPQHAALDRQLRFEEQLRWYTNNHDFAFEALCIYDQMAGVDEAIVNGKKVKRRGTVETAQAAVSETLRSAAYYHAHRNEIRGTIAFVGQGVTPDQYINDCLLPMFDVMQAGDWFAFGGFCIIGRQPSLLPVFQATYTRALPLLKRKGINRVHILGVCYPPAITFASEVARRERVIVSTDSSAPEQAACIGGAVYQDGKQCHGVYDKEHKRLDEREYLSALERGEHVYHPWYLANSNIRSYHDWTVELAA